MRCCGRNSARRGGSAAQYRKRGIHSVPLVGAAEHRTARRLRRSKIAELHDSLAAQCQSSRFPAKRDIRHAGHPPNPRKRRGFAAGKRTSDTSLIIIHQKKDVCQYRRRRIFPFGDSGGRFSSPKHGRGRSGTPVSGVRTETNVNAQRRTCRTEVWIKCMRQTHPAARKSAFRIVNTAHGA